jgi:putative transposase
MGWVRALSSGGYFLLEGPSNLTLERVGARCWITRFGTWYNHEHRHSAIRFITPRARHTGEDRALLARRTHLNTEARAANPARWSRQIRNWAPVGDICLNLERDTRDRKIRDAT